MKKFGIYNPYLETKGGGEKVCLALAEALSNNSGNRVELITHSKVDLGELERYFSVDLSKVTVRELDFKTLYVKLVNRFPFLPGAIKHLLNDIKIKRDISKLKYDTFINNCYQSNLPGPAKNNIYMCMFPQKISGQYSELNALKRIYKEIVSLLYRVLLHPTKKHAVYTYDKITANSAFTQKYIKKYWGIDSDIIYPICDDMLDKTLNIKKKMILNVGRFFEKNGENHHKRQDILIDSFINNPELHRDGWELHLAGSVAEDVGGLKYILSLIKMSKGFPVYFHFNCSYPELKKLYNESSIYWHATGYGSDPEKHPEKQEHFGITTVEAMSTGAVPVVINTAGQKESVNHNKSGYLWDSKEELLKYTRDLIKDEDKKHDLSTTAVKDSKKYSKKAFSIRVKEVF